MAAGDPADPGRARSRRGKHATPLGLRLPLHPDWRWLLEREDSPRYPIARL